MNSLEKIINKIKNDPSESFYYKDKGDDKLLDWNSIESLLNDFYRNSYDTIELISQEHFKIDIPAVDEYWTKFPRPDTSFLFEKINCGHSLVILGASRINKKINNLCKKIEDVLGNCSVDVHVYCGLKKSKSFTAHFDTADNLILHQTGRCYWKVYKQYAADCLYERNVDGSKLDVEFETEIGPKDVIYVPRYQYHECIPLKKRISLSFPIIDNINTIDRNWYRIKND